MNEQNKPRPYKDERDRDIQLRSESHALEFMIAATQILTIICLFKHNPAWKGSLSLLFIGGATQLFYKYRSYEAKAYLYVGGGVLLIGLCLLLQFAFS